MFVSGITGIAGISFSQGISAVQLILISIASFLSYGFGQALTDCFQIDTDSISSPYRPLTQNVVSKKSFMLTSVIGLSLCVAIFAVYYPGNLAAGVIAGCGLATYTYFKRRWWGGPFYNAWIVLVLFFMAALASNVYTFSQNVYYAAAAVLFGYANFVLSGYFKDISADKATGYNTLLVVFGRKASAIVSDIFAVLLITASFMSISSGSENYLSSNIPCMLLFLTGSFLAIYAQIRLHAVKTDQEAFRAIAPVVHSYILLLSSIVLSNKPGWIIPIGLFYIGYILVLKIRPSKEQI